MWPFLFFFCFFYRLSIPTLEDDFLKDKKSLKDAIRLLKVVFFLHQKVKYKTDKVKILIMLNNIQLQDLYPV